MLGVGRDGLGDCRFVIAILFKRGAHLLNCAKHFRLSEARSGLELAGALKLRVHGWADCAFDAHGADKRARAPNESQRYTAGLARGLNFDAVIKAGCVELAETSFEVVGGERCSFGLIEMAGQRGEAVGGNALERDALND
jgi:hypothetical protein